jgi:hypothetical protein
MYKHLFRFLFALLLVFIVCGTAQATNLQITVQDSLDNTTISQATVYLNGANIGMTTSTGTYLITHSGLADLNLRVIKSGYDDWEQTVAMNTTSLLVNMTRKSLILKVRLYDSDSTAMISGADVKLTGNNVTETQKTDSNGIASFAVKANMVYDIAITAPYYQSWNPAPVEIGAENREVQYWLLRNDRFSFVVTDKNNKPVADAEVYIDAVLKGKTDARGILTLQLERGNPVAIEVKKAGYESYIERKTIGENEALVSIEISKVPVGAFVSVFDENKKPVEDASVYLDDSLTGRTDQYGRYILGSIIAGSYQLEVRKNGYTTVKKQITVTKQGDIFTVDLPYEQTDLTVFTQDKEQKVVPGVKIFLNGDTIGSTNENGQVVAKVKYNTLYNITASKEGYQPATVEKEVIIGNSSGSATLSLEKNVDWGFVTLIIIGAVGVIILFALIRHVGRRSRRHIIRRDEI